MLGEPYENVIVLSNEFFEEVTAHPIPADLEAVKVISSAPAVLDLFVWLSYRWLYLEKAGTDTDLRAVWTGAAVRGRRIRAAEEISRKAPSRAQNDTARLAGVPCPDHPRWKKPDDQSR